MAFDGSTEDRLAIRERLEAYADAVFRQDEAAWAACWAENAVWHFAGLDLRGVDAIRETWRAAMAPFSLTLFYVVPGEIIVTGDRASARSYTDETLVLAEGGTRWIAGRYDDQLVRNGNIWRFAERRYALLYERPHSHSPV